MPKARQKWRNSMMSMRGSGRIDYEALALAICALCQDDWSPPPGLRLRVSVRQPVVEHIVEMRRFESWLNGVARSPREKIMDDNLKADDGRWRVTT